MRALLLACGLSHLLTCPLPAQLPPRTNAVTVRVVLMLPADWAGQDYSGMTFDLRGRDELLLWPCNDCGGGGGTNTINGITNINGLVTLVQTFATSAAGTDFAIVSAGSTHTFRLPTASGVNRGALSASDWSLFSSKQAGDADLSALAAIAGVQGDVIYHDGASWVRLGAGTTGFKLETRGAGNNPVWDTDETGGAGSSLTIATNDVIFVTPATNLNFVIGRFLEPILATNNSGDVDVQFNLAATTTNRSLTVSNGLYLGQPTGATFPAELYTPNIAGGVYQQTLLVGSTTIVIGTNGNTLIVRGDLLRPNDDDTTVFGGAANRWKDGFFKGIVRVDGTVRASTNAEANRVHATNAFVLGDAPANSSWRLTNSVTSTNVYWMAGTDWQAGQLWKVHSVTYDGATAHVVMTNAVDNATGTPGGAFPMFQFHDTGGVFAGTTNLTWDATNSWAKLSFPFAYPAGMGRLNISNIVLGTPAILLAGTGHNTPGFLAIDDTGLQASYPATLAGAIYITFDGDNSSPPNNIARSGAGWMFTNDLVTAGVNLTPLLNAFQDIGYSDFRVRTNWAASVDLSRVLTLRDQSAVASGQATILKHFEGMKVTNRIDFSLTNPVAGQVLKIAAVNNIAPSTKQIIVTNDTDATGGGGGLVTNANQFGASVTLTLKADPLVTNVIAHAADTNQTNLVLAQPIGQAVPMFAIRGSNNAPIVQFDNRGFQVLTNTLTNYSLGNTRSAPAGTIVQGVDGPRGWNAPAWTDDRGRTFTADSAIYNTPTFYLSPGSGTVIFSHGPTPVHSGGSTASHESPHERLPYMSKLASAATSNSVGGTSIPVNLWNSGAHNGSSRVGGSFFFSRWMVTNNIPGIVGGGAGRIFVGLSADTSTAWTNICVTTNYTTAHLGFMVDAPNSLGIYLACRDTALLFRTNIGMNFVATNDYEMSIEQAHTNRFIRWTVRNLTERTEVFGTHSNGIATNFMRPVIMSKNMTNRENEIYCSKLFINPHTSPRGN